MSESPRKKRKAKERSSKTKKKDPSVEDMGQAQSKKKRKIMPKVPAGAGDETKAKATTPKATDADNPTADPISVPFAEPMIPPKLKKRIYKLIKTQAKEKNIKRGIKEVVKAMRKEEKGICVLAANVTPMDVITHIPGLCETKDVPYGFVDSKEALGAAAGTKKSTSVIMISKPTIENVRYSKCEMRLRKMAYK